MNGGLATSHSARKAGGEGAARSGSRRQSRYPVKARPRASARGHEGYSPMEGALGSGKSLLFTRGAVEATSASRRKRARDDARGRRGVTEHTRGSASAGGGEDNAPPKDATTGRSGLAIVKWQAPRSGHAPRREPAVRGCSYSNQLRQADVGPLHLSIAIRGLVARRPGESGLARSNPLSPSTWQGRPRTGERGPRARSRRRTTFSIRGRIAGGNTRMSGHDGRRFGSVVVTL